MTNDVLLSRFRIVRGHFAGGTLSSWPAWIETEPAQPDLPPKAYALERRQFAADVLLAAMEDAGGGEARIAVTPADLFLERRPFVFGASIPVRGVAIVSTARLEGSAMRLEKVMRHELGHLAGLPDCDAACLMTPASSCADIDRRSRDLCPLCAAHLAALPVIA